MTLTVTVSVVTLIALATLGERQKLGLFFYVSGTPIVNVIRSFAEQIAHVNASS